MVGTGEPRVRPAGVRGRIAVLVVCLLLGFGVVVAVRSAASPQGLSRARTADLATILTDLTARQERLRAELGDLEATRARVADGTARAQDMVDAAQRRADTLGVMAGTVPVTGPGLELTIDDPGSRVGPDVFLDILAELRNAGAEAIQIGPVRVTASTWVTGARGGGIVVDGLRLQPPYPITAVGDPPTMSAAMGIPGGIADAVADRAGATLRISPDTTVAVTALHPIVPPRYARAAASEAPTGR